MGTGPQSSFFSLVFLGCNQSDFRQNNLGTMPFPGARVVPRASISSRTCFFVCNEKEGTQQGKIIESGHLAFISSKERASCC